LDVGKEDNGNGMVGKKTKLMRGWREWEKREGMEGRNMDYTEQRPKLSAL